MHRTSDFRFTLTVLKESKGVRTCLRCSYKRLEDIMSKVVTILSVFTLLFVVTACGDESSSSSSSSSDAAVAACQSRCARVAGLSLSCPNETSDDVCQQGCAVYGMVSLSESCLAAYAALYTCEVSQTNWSCGSTGQAVPSDSGACSSERTAQITACDTSGS